jgi:hypothetical protein
MEWRSIRWTRAGRLAGIAVGAVGAIALASAVVGAPEAPRLDRDIGLRVTDPPPTAAPTSAPIADAHPAPREPSRAVREGVHDRHRERRDGARAERTPPRPKPAPVAHAPEAPPSPQAPPTQPAVAPAAVQVQAAPVAQSFPPAPIPAPAPNGAGDSTSVQREFGFEN